MIYLLGHKGFVGSAFARHMKKNRIKFVGIDRENYESLKGTECDIFINAGGSSKKRLAELDPRKDFELNVISTLNSVFDFKFKKYILISSVDVYNDVSNPKNNKETSEINPEKLSNYGFSKWACEQIVRKHCKNWVIFRLGGMVGLGLKKNAIFDLINSGSLYVSPMSEYQYINTEDVARIILSLSGKRNEIFNLCGSGTVILEDVAKNMKIDLQKDLYSLRKEKYNINISKIKKVANIRKTSDTVLEFMSAVK